MILFSRDLVELILQGQLASGRLRTLAITRPRIFLAEEGNLAEAAQVNGGVS